MMFSRASHTLRRGLQRSVNTPQQTRSMGGGSFMTVSETHTKLGEAFTVVCWLWIFHRARQDLPVVLGFRHPWEHAHDPFEPHVHHPSPAEAETRSGSWDSFSKNSLKTSEDDDDEEEEEEEDEEDDE